jgi:hypothetical protein
LREDELFVDVRADVLGNVGVAEQLHHPDYMPFSSSAYEHGPLYAYDDGSP